MYRWGPLPVVVLLKKVTPIRRTMDSAFGKMPTTSALRFSSLFHRASEFVEGKSVRCCAGNAL